MSIPTVFSPHKLTLEVFVYGAFSLDFFQSAYLHAFLLSSSFSGNAVLFRGCSGFSEVGLHYEKKNIIKPSTKHRVNSRIKEKIEIY